MKTCNVPRVVVFLTSELPVGMLTSMFIAKKQDAYCSRMFSKKERYLDKVSVSAQVSGSLKHLKLAASFSLRQRKKNELFLSILL